MQVKRFPFKIKDLRKGYFRSFLSVLARLARFRVVGFLDLASLFSFFAGIFSPFFTPAWRRNAPLFFAVAFCIQRESLAIGFSN